MASLSDAIVGAVIGPLRIEAMSLQGLMVTLRGIAGTVTEAARLAGIDRRTWQRYESGAIRNPGKIGQIRDAVRRALADERRGPLVAAGGRMVIKGEICVSNDCRKGRKLDLSRYFSTSTRGAIVDQVAAGDAAGAAAAFEAGLETDYDAPGMYVNDVTYLDWR